MVRAIAMRLFCLNVERSAHLHRFLPFLCSQAPDVACLQELMQSDVEAIQAETGLRHCHYVPMARMSDDPGAPPFGVGILSRHPIAAANTLVYAGGGDGFSPIDRSSPEARATSIRFCAATARIALPGFELTIATTHFPWTDAGQPRPFQYEAAHRLIEMLGREPLVLCGDFNAPRGGPIFSQFAGRWRDCIPADISTSIDPALHRAGALELMVDGLFTTEDFAVHNVRMHCGVSDHKAITADIEPVGTGVVAKP